MVQISQSVVQRHRNVENVVPLSKLYCTGWCEISFIHVPYTLGIMALQYTEVLQV